MLVKQWAKFDPENAGYLIKDQAINLLNVPTFRVYDGLYFLPGNPTRLLKSTLPAGA
jgi:hypothetical protein